MSRGVNRVFLLGRTGKDPLVHTSANGQVTNISLATTESWKDKTSGEKQERTEWHRVVFFGRLAEIVGQYVKKGSLLYLEGRLQTRKWQDKEGKDRYTTEIVANEMQMLGSRGGNAASGQDAPEHGTPTAPAPQERPDAVTRGLEGGDNPGDNIPF
mgnify:CR=1 FL=1